VGTLNAGIIRNGGSDVIIDLDASGTDKIIDATNFWIKADGSAQFGGDIYSTALKAATTTVEGVLRVGNSGYAQYTASGCGFYDSGGTNARLFASFAGGAITYGGGSGHSSTKFVNVDTGFFGATPVAKPTVTGSRGSNAALASALTALANLGLITDSST
jgi:hypothetical protein